MDVPTLLLTTALVVVLMGVLLMTAHGQRSDSFALAVWGLALLTGAAGLVLTALTSRFGPVADAAGTALLVLASGISWTAARLFAGRRPRPVLLIAGAALWLGVQAIRGGGGEAAAALASAVGAAYTLAAAVELWRARLEHLPSLGPAVALQALHGGVYAVHALPLRMAWGPFAGSVPSLIILESLLHTIGIGFLLVGMARERQELHATAQLRVLAQVDGLTGVANRRRFDDYLATTVRRGLRQRQPMALLLIDVDQFKAYNEAVGHQQGDACLRTIAQTLALNVRERGDFVARYGGEEFVIVLVGAGGDDAAGRAEQLRAAVAACGIHHPATQGTMTISVGIGLYEPAAAATDAQSLLAAADRALYAAKAAGRDAVRIARPGTEGG